MKHLLQTLITFWPSILLLGLSAIPAAYMHSHDHGKLKGPKDDGFFGWFQSERKYKKVNGWRSTNPSFWGSTTFLVFLTDAYHASQAIMRLLMSLSITLAIGAHWWFAGVTWFIYATIHWAGYKLLSR